MRVRCVTAVLASSMTSSYIWRHEVCFSCITSLFHLLHAATTWLGAAHHQSGRWARRKAWL